MSTRFAQAAEDALRDAKRIANQNDDEKLEAQQEMARGIVYALLDVASAIRAQPERIDEER